MVTYGFVGVGTMSSAIVRGICTLPAPPCSAVILSPRGAEKAAALKSGFPTMCAIAADNQEVVDKSDVIFIGVLPKQAEEVLRALKFSDRHTVVSLISTAPMSLLHEVCAPATATNIVRTIPLPPVAKHRGATVMTPPHPSILPLFESLGTVVAVETEVQMKKLMSVTALMGQFYAQQRAAQQWLQTQGVDADSAAKWTGAVFHCISYDSANANSHTFNELVEEQTPGGLNDQVVREFTEGGVYDALKDSLDAVLSRVEGREAPKLQKVKYSSKEASGKGKGKGKEKADAKPAPQKKPKFQKVGSLNPNSKGVNLVVKIVSDGTAVEGGPFFEFICGDASGQITLSVTEVQKESLQKDKVVIIRNAAVKMVKGYMRLCVDKWGKFDNSTEEAVETVGTKNVSATEYELVGS